MTFAIRNSIASDRAAISTPLSDTGGADQESLISSRTDDLVAWNDALERVLSWRNETVDPSDTDSPSIEIVDTALDFIADHREWAGRPSPTLIVPSGDGKIAFEWHSNGMVTIVEFVARGRARVTEFSDGRVVNTMTLIRNPTSRRIQLAE
jgi:hypothetical protein